jgi:GT2 family glycosyltransferase
LYKNNLDYTEIIVVDNGSSDGSQSVIRKEFPKVRLIENKINTGYAGGCNIGMKEALGNYFLLLNNDVEVASNFLVEMLKAVESDKTIGFVQPKILSIQRPEYFDYSGGAGGEIDVFGFPFARGRVFIKIEKDELQYDDFPREIFWASGTAVLVRRSLVEKIGLLDEDFFAHMEEIDLNWRGHLAGYKSVITSNTKIFHYSGYTLSAENPRKMYLNHRNNLIMILKNYSVKSLIWVLPIRIFLEFVALGYATVTQNSNWAKGVLRGLAFVIKNFNSIWKKHKQVQKFRAVSDSEIMKSMYKGSVALTFFLQLRSVRQICGFKKHKIY